MERRELERLIEEQIIKEGWWSRLKARTTGSSKALRQVGRNLKAAAAGDPENLQNIKFVRSSQMAQSRVRAFANKLNKIGIDFIGDLESLFGEGMGDAPDNIRARLEELEEGFDHFVGELNDLYEMLEAEKFHRGEKK